MSRVFVLKLIVILNKIPQPESLCPFPFCSMSQCLCLCSPQLRYPFAPILQGMLMCNLLPTVALRFFPSIEFVASPSPSYSSPVACISLHFYKLNLILLFSACISLSCFILHFLILTCIISPNLTSSANLMNVVLFFCLHDY